LRSPRTLATTAVCFAGFASVMPAGQAQVASAVNLARCAAIPGDADRLACYDQLARNHPGTAATSAAPPVQPVQPETPGQSFGRPPLASKPPEQSRIQAKVVDMTTDSRGTIVKLDNDQTWTIDDGPAMVRAGDAIVIKRAALGSYLMSTPTNRVYRVRRLQ